MSVEEVNKSFICKDLEQTAAVAKSLAALLKKDDIVCFQGNLGAGKTTLIKSIIQFLNPNLQEDDITSPTFNYLHTYQAEYPIFHFDLYRLESAENFLLLGFEEYLHAGLTLIEWPDRISQLLPPQRFEVDLSITEPNCRIIEFRRLIAKTFI